jgi:8-oxo-dGTP pyrophosphatase MutT (NUDIX family)
MDRRRPATREALNEGPATIPRQAASVILLREAGAGGFEVLLVERNPAQRFMGGYWVFPGGAVDAGEGEGEAAHRAAAVRELREEAGVSAVAASELVYYSRWITPELLRIRFDTRFFLALAPAGTVAVCDGHECVDLRWDSPLELLAAYARGTLELAFPTHRQLEQLSAFATARAAIEHARAQTVRPVLPRVVTSGEIARIVLPGEPGYDAGSAAAGDV